MMSLNIDDITEILSNHQIKSLVNNTHSLLEILPMKTSWKAKFHLVSPNETIMKIYLSLKVFETPNENPMILWWNFFMVLWICNESFIGDISLCIHSTKDHHSLNVHWCFIYKRNTFFIGWHKWKLCFHDVFIGNISSSHYSVDDKSLPKSSHIMWCGNMLLYTLTQYAIQHWNILFQSPAGIIHCTSSKAFTDYLYIIVFHLSVCLSVRVCVVRVHVCVSMHYHQPSYII